MAPFYCQISPTSQIRRFLWEIESWNHFKTCKFMRMNPSRWSIISRTWFWLGNHCSKVKYFELVRIVSLCEQINQILLQHASSTSSSSTYSSRKQFQNASRTINQLQATSINAITIYVEDKILISNWGCSLK